MEVDHHTLVLSRDYARIVCAIKYLWEIAGKMFMFILPIFMFLLWKGNLNRYAETVIVKQFYLYMHDANV